MTLVLRINSTNPEKSKIRSAAKCIRNGGVVVFPTETVYGIGANAFDGRAAAKIFRIKKRAMDNPLIVHVSDMEMAKRVGYIPQRYVKVLEGIWPAPLTIIVKAKSGIPKAVTSGLSTISIRMPDSKIALELIRESGVPIAAPSANPSKLPSSTRSSHAMKYFYGKVDVIIDSEPSKFGIESTIIDLRTFTLLRPGAFTVDQIERAFKRDVRVTSESRGISESGRRPISPGTKYRHYSPATPIFMFTGSSGELRSIASEFKGRFVFIGSDESCSSISGNKVRVIRLGRRSDGKRIASNLFDSLISIDDMKPEFAIIESFSEKGIGLAIMNRVRKACANKSFNSRKGLYNLLNGG